jgi:mRNA interferase HigB
MLVIFDQVKLTVQEKAALKKLDVWKSIAEKSNWKYIMDVKEVIPSASGNAKGSTTIFNIGGNDCRLITVIDYDTQIIFVEDLLSHSECDKWNKAK